MLSKKMKSKELDYEMEIESDEDLKKVIRKKTKGKNGIVTKTKVKKIGRVMNIPSYDEPLIKKELRGKKFLSQGKANDKGIKEVDTERDTMDMDEENLN